MTEPLDTTLTGAMLVKRSFGGRRTDLFENLFDLAFVEMDGVRRECRIHREDYRKEREYR